VSQFSKDVNKAAKDGDGLSESVKALGENLVSTTAFIVDAGDGVVRVFGIASDTIVGLYATAVGHMSSLMSDLANGLSKVTFGEMSQNFAKEAASLRDEANINFGAAGEAAAGIGEKLEKSLAGSRLKQYWADAKAVAAEAAKATAEANKGGAGSGVDPAKIKQDAADAKKAASDAEAAAKKLQGTFDTTEQAYQRDIELINTSVDARKNATEVAKLQFEIETGKLVGINAEQQKRLLALAAELDVKKKLKQANEDEAKAAAYAATLAEANQTAKSGFDQELAGAGMGDKARDRLKQDLQIRQDYDRQMAELQKQRNSGDISPELYTKETGQLQEALASRMVIQQDYYNQLDQAQSDWMSGVSDAWANYRDQAADSASQAKELFSDALNGTEDAIVSFIKTGKLSFKDLADSIIEDLIRIQVKQAAVGLLSSAFSFISGGSSALGSSTSSGFSQTLTANAKGGVYDSPSLSSFSNGVFDTPQMFAFAKGAGIFAEAGPEAIMPLTRAADGSLGVRAVGSAGSAAPESAVAGASATGGVTQHITVQGSADDATLARIQQAARQGAQDGYALVLRDFKQNGPARQMINRR
jgi:lambda family phage tail tape measure protein